MNNSSYSTIKLTEENFDLLKPLMLDCFGMDVELKYFKWKFLDNPVGKVIGFLAIHKDTNEVAAYYGVIPELYLIENEETIIYQSCDTMTHSKHRRQGLFQLLSVKCFDTLRESNQLFIIGFSGEMSTPGFIKFGWKHVFNMKYYFVPKTPKLFKIKVSKNIQTITDYSLIEHLTLESNNQKNIHSHKTSEIYHWRLSNPRKEYITIAYLENEEYKAYLTYYVEDKKIYLFDFNLKNKKDGKELTRELKRLMKREKVTGIVAYVQENSNLSKELKQFGFISNPFSKGPLSTKGPFIFYSTDKYLLQYNDASNWLIGSFDHDAM